MRLVIQRVSRSSVTVYEEGFEYQQDHILHHEETGKGLLILAGIEETDLSADIDWLVGKASQMRIFDDQDGIMNLSVKDIDGECLVISQFTLFASTKKGNRPSWLRAAKGSVSQPLYEEFCRKMSAALGKEVRKGIFGADMKVELVNDGPVTIIIDSHNRE
ncbi:MAG: D-aminoacyl-tRNA deacylase [Bacteroidales bacterium]|nr:D-aminoacyl-tRNA deacylase [Bacteroidales bacterium]MCM1146774.1 D-aminoacyl-tRNA deacylase [Bacteroidales bacterium]MCM1205729.1 D-aminoacyl-tRNA deacylase [Bacillota bacterium]MCM1510741.1 D-aminoacyl-tRNA deacylase [Clostridium sp.]